MFFGGGAIRFGGFKSYLKNDKMNKVYSKKELKARAQEVFEQYPSEDKVFAREDGNIFFNENLADLGRGKLKVYPFDRSDIVKSDKAVEDIEVNAEVIHNTPTVDTLKVDTLKVEAPVVDFPAVDTPKVEAPKVDKTLGKDGKNPETRNSNKNK
jgi:hypothetical protein